MRELPVGRDTHLTIDGAGRALRDDGSYEADVLRSSDRLACARDSAGLSWIARFVAFWASSCRPMSPNTKPSR